jgi:hypothetical protein
LVHFYFIQNTRLAIMRKEGKEAGMEKIKRGGRKPRKCGILQYSWDLGSLR